MTKFIINTDKATTWLGFIGSLLLLLENQGIIDKNLSTFILALIYALFGYLTNKVRIRKELDGEDKTKMTGIEFEV